MRTFVVVLVLTALTYGLWSADDALMLGRYRMAVAMRMPPATPHF